ncbi:extracellular solute-binding protein [Arcanobacterium haemolyticum]|uniref:Extracellular solute-binding protein family 1 n=1 Tax=Arcanobacterium haemolyticum (strain ATCC 9345 / DSM 20595 / CCM 5947 / CCUG 17215 / LMG 16163 / NBRC 15585 / NCTC 8452 / 11018) TaxID=644284 RepID=D7BMU3_ARCHD|nr:extracellular solute-binding protein [Arcanobacterium haemolyticum]ADH92242.1 extracellular solute-binding protein family 1 [Arcanobacterium haemolyticum DSM 20595]QCX46393.1 extracellular solute-binding protein [Arcanobacterium haemolyticum]SQH29047.1 glycerol-3-phosphate transporter periplasmic binding protein [Arcanobacterium haemolyticum]
MERKLTNTAAIATAALLALSGCMGGSGKATNADSSSDIPTPKVNCEIPEANINNKPVKSDKIEGEITFQTQGLKGTFDDFVNKKIADFEKLHPGTKIKWTDIPGGPDFDTTMITQASNCSMADVVNIASSTVLALSKANLLLNFDVKTPDVGKEFIPGVWNSVKFGAGESHTAYPWYFGPFLTTYNKQIFEKAGLDPEKAPATMDEYFDNAHKIAAAKTGAYSLYGNTSWYMVPQWRAIGVEMMNSDHSEFTFAKDKAALAWVTHMADLYKEGAIPPDSMTGDMDMSLAYGEGNLAYGTPNASFLRNVKTNAQATYDVTGVGKEALNKGMKPIFDGQYLAVSVTTKNAPLATEWAKFFTSPEAGLEWARFGIDTGLAVVFPATTEALKDPSLSAVEGNGVFEQARRLAAEEALDAEAYIPLFYVTGAVADSLQKNVNLAVVGEMSPQEALDTAQAEMNKLLKKLNK